MSTQKVHFSHHCRYQYRYSSFHPNARTWSLVHFLHLNELVKMLMGDCYCVACTLSSHSEMVFQSRLTTKDQGPKPADCVRCFFSNSLHAYVGRSVCGCEHCSLEPSRLQLSISHWSSFCLRFCLQTQCKPCILVWLQRFSHLPSLQHSPTSSGVHNPNHAATSGTWHNVYTHHCFAPTTSCCASHPF